MNGAIAEPWVRINKPPSKAIIRMNRHKHEFAACADELPKLSEYGQHRRPLKIDFSLSRAGAPAAFARSSSFSRRGRSRAPVGACLVAASRDRLARRPEKTESP